MKKIFFIILILVSSFYLSAQFYQGHQTTFGKNRIQYRNFEWRFYRYPTYDIYYYKGGRALAHFANKYITQTIREYEHFFNQRLNKRLIIIIYNNLTDFKQTNIGLSTGNINLELPATTRVLDNKIFIYYQGNQQDFIYQIRYALAKKFINEVLYGSAFSRRYTSSNIMNLPLWFTDGLASYVADPYNLQVDNYLRDFFLHKKRIKFNSITRDQAQYLGHSIWAFVAQQYGKDVIPNILYFSRIYKNLSNAFYFVIGVKIKILNKLWLEYYQNKYHREIANSQEFDSAFVLKKHKKNILYSQIKYSRANGLYAYVQNKQGRYKIIIYDPDKNKKKVIYRGGHRLEEITDYSYPIIVWRPDGEVLSFITEQNGVAFINHYNLEEKKLSRTSIAQVSKILSIAYSPNSRYLVISAMQGDFVDLFVYNSVSGVMRKITNDPYEDLFPQFIDRGRKIIFVSNRDKNIVLKRISSVEQADSLSRNYDLYIYDMRHHSRILQRITNTPYSNETQPYEVGKDSYLFLSDSTGITNRFTINYDSIIDYVDTAVHYKYFTKLYPLTNYPTSILDHDFDRRNRQITETKLWNQRTVFSSYKQNLNANAKISAELKITPEKAELIKQWQKQDKKIRQAYQWKIKQQQAIDSMLKYMKSYKPQVRDTFVDIYNYTFEMEHDSMLRMYYQYQLEQRKKSRQSKKWGKSWIYQPTFYITNTSSTFDYSQIIQTYQPFNGGPFVFSPQMNLFSVVESKELFENYRLMAGFRLGGDLRSTEYIASFEDLTRRLDKQIIYHRLSLFNQPNFIGYNYVMTKDITHELIFRFSYPFSQVASVRTTVLGRYDRRIQLLTDYASLNTTPDYKYYAGEKVEFIYDNTIQLAPNLYDGLRFKIFAESYQQIKGNQYWLAVGGMDFRYYKEIWRNMIFAWRLAGSTNTGSGKLIYYLGGVDYWYTLTLNPLQDKPSNFNRDVLINYNNNYIFQAVATPMRGYKQNIRNGTTFLLMNTEVRMPIVRMILNRPISSSFWANLQVIGFFDIGSAWCGRSPSDSCNAYNTYYVHNPPITMIVDLERPPYVAGYGFGIRTKILGYFTRFDFAWGYEGGVIHPMQFYLSLAYDF